MSLERPSVSSSTNSTTAAVNTDHDSALSAPARIIHANAHVGQGGPALAIIGRSPVFVNLLEHIIKVAPYRECVLITGESGAGKEGVAQAIHALEPRRAGPFVSVSCPQYQEGNLTVSELFGHVKGSFTGAVADHPGAFAQAHKGTLFLDEIADLPSAAQAMLLRTLSTGEYKPIGASVGRCTDVRVLAATNRPLNALMLSGAFRHDLFFRLRHFHLLVPPLRERGDDWRLIADHCLCRLSERYGVSKSLSTAAERCLSAYAWPGNVRQLISVISAAFALADSTVIDEGDVVSQLDDYQAPATTAPADSTALMQVPESPPLAPDPGMGSAFWERIHRGFLDRELNRSQVRGFIARGLAAADGTYRGLIAKLGLPPEDYQRFMDFLRHHDLKPDRSEDI
jgi:DNA-binding NtrC family response regulator